LNLNNYGIAMKDTFLKVVNLLMNSKNIVFFTGAGISAESGVATFRGSDDSIWSKFKPEELANFNAFMRNPDLVWEWYQYRREIISNVKPNPAHITIAKFEQYFPNLAVITQNVDNLHKRAGSTNVFELHGNIERNYCIQCHTYYNTSDFDLKSKSVPKCKCGGLIRPDIVWFGEALPEYTFSKSKEIAETADVIFIIGTSGVVYPAAYIPVWGKQNGAKLIEINITYSELSNYCDFTLLGKAGEILPVIFELFTQNVDKV
jgi:NAD-dependent deacetylase